MATLSKTEFLDGLKKSGIIEPETLQKWVEENDAETPKELATRLVKQGKLTLWQAKYLMSGRTRLNIGSYQLLERIQRDDLGDRFLALHKSLQRKVDIQVLPATLSKDKDKFAPFIQQASKVATLDHPNLIHVYDIDQEGGRYFLVSEHFAGNSLAEQDPSSITPHLIAKITREILQGLQYAHENDVVHGSIKPKDVVFTEDGEIKLNHIAISPLRSSLKGETTPSAPTAKNDLAALTKLGLSLLSKVPEEKLDATYVRLTKVINSFADGEGDSVDKAIVELESFAEAAPTDPLDLAAESMGDGGFDSPASTLAPRPKKKPAPAKEETPKEKEPEQSNQGWLTNFRQSNPAGFIATSAILGLALIGGSVFGAMKFLAQPESLANAGANAGTDKATPVSVEPTTEKSDAATDSRAEQANKDFKDKSEEEKQAAVAQIFAAQENESVKEPAGPGNESPPVNATPGFKGANQPAPIKENSLAAAPEPAEASPTNATALTAQPIPASNTNMPPEYLRRISGIGETTQTILYERGITQFRQIGELTPDQLRAVLDGVRYIKNKKNAELQLWINQARLFAGMDDESVTKTDGLAMNSTPAEAPPADSATPVTAPPATSGNPQTTTEPATTPEPNTTSEAKPAAPAPASGEYAPFKSVPREIKLPPISDLEEKTIAPLQVKKIHKFLGAKILSEPGITKLKVIFELTRGDKATGNKTDEEKQRWLIGTKRRAKDEPDNFAVLRKSDSHLYFQWLPEAEKTRNAELVRNCKIQLELPDKNKTKTFFSLRAPEPIPDLRLTEDKFENTQSVEIPAMPLVETITVQAMPMRVPGTEISVNRSQIVVAPPLSVNSAAELWLKRSDKTGFLRIYVSGFFKKNKLMLQSNLFFVDQPKGANSPTFIKIESKDQLATLANQLIQARNNATNLYNVKKNENGLAQYKKDEFESAMKAATKRVELMAEYSEVLQKLFNQPISVRVTAKLGKSDVILVETDPKMEQNPAPKKNDKRRKRK